MPRVVKPEEEIVRMRAEQKADPEYRHAVATKVDVGIYIQLLEDCIMEGDKNISRAINRALEGYYQIKNNPVGVTISDTERLLLKALTLHWSVTPDEAMRRLLRIAGKRILEESLAETEELRRTLETVQPASKR